MFMLLLECSYVLLLQTVQRKDHFLHLRSTMSSERLNSLAILNIESSITKTIDYNDIITSFASKQSRRKL